jgi:hypothetical protein
MPTVYPYYRAVQKNVGQALIPSVNAEIQVFKSGTNQEWPVYSNADGTNLLTQPLLTDSEGIMFFYAPPGRIRIDVRLDGANVISIEDVIVDVDSLVLPVVGEVPSGTINSVNTTFILSLTPNPNRVAVYSDGVRLVRTDGTPVGGQFAVSNTSILIGTAPVNSVIVDYWTA